jgi:hypothetical protein
LYHTNVHLSSQGHHQLSTWRVLKVYLDLFAPPLPSNHTIGLSMPPIHGCRPFILIPRKSALSILPRYGMQGLYNSLCHIQTLHSTLTRGHAKLIFGDKHQRVQYNTLGVRPKQAGKGVIDLDAWTHSIGRNHWRNVMRMVRRTELVFESFAPDEVLQHIKSAKDIVPFRTMRAPTPTTDSHHPSTKAISPAKYFGCIAFGCNVFLRCHTDNDFTLSMAHILLDGIDCYDFDDDIVVYFFLVCFLGNDRAIYCVPPCRQ